VPILIALNVLAALVLGVYALHEGLLLALYARHRLRRRRLAARSAGPVPEPPAEAPSRTVTVQLPLYNERYVAERIIASACALDYPRDLLQIQVLDDSSDETAGIAQRAVDAARARGHNICLIRRENRKGYKAGALANGLTTASGDFIAIFDADFIPERDFLTRLLSGPASAFADPRVGFVQTRWTYLNRDERPVTRAQAIMLDMHFVIEQPARSDAGLLMNFNGSGGVWRRSAIDDAGGWQSDTLSEDLDLSYRAELRGWTGVYFADQPSPSEIPRDTLAFKLQQARWARGSARCVRKLVPLIWAAPITLRRKLLGTIHISGYFIQPMILVLAATSPLLGLLSAGAGAAPISAASLIGLLPLLSMFVAHQAQGRSAFAFLRDLPAVVMIGIGLSLSNSFALIAGLLGTHAGEFARTPKAGARSHAATRGRYALRADWTTLIELVAGVSLLGISAYLATSGAWSAAAGAALYGCGYSVTAASQLRLSTTSAPSLR